MDWGTDTDTIHRRTSDFFACFIFAQRPNDPETVETILSLLDRNRNEHVDFHEYLLMVFQLAQACYHRLDNESYGDRTSQQERKQEGTQGHTFPRNTGRQQNVCKLETE